MSATQKKVALILSNNFDTTGFLTLHDCLMHAGILVSVVGEKEGMNLHSWDKNSEVLTEVSFDEARSYDFDAAIVSGRFSPDEIRTIEPALAFVRDIYHEGKLVGAIDHGPQVLISADIVSGKNVTGWHSTKIDLENAGAHYLDEAIVVDENIITGQGPENIDEFCKAILSELSTQLSSTENEEAA